MNFNNNNHEENARNIQHHIFSIESTNPSLSSKERNDYFDNNFLLPQNNLIKKY